MSALQFVGVAFAVALGVLVCMDIAEIAFGWVSARSA